jgi:DNA-binding helix-hairpin-helix protein with protein kinase domain
MQEEEILEALLNGAILRVSDDGDVSIAALDDLSPELRECFRASKQHDYQHKRQCPGCLENQAENTLFEAGLHREEGNEAAAQELENEAANLRAEAAKIRESSHILQ